MLGERRTVAVLRIEKAWLAFSARRRVQPWYDAVEALLTRSAAALHIQTVRVHAAHYHMDVSLLLEPCCRFLA